MDAKASSLVPSWDVFTQFGIVGLMIGVLLAVTITGIWMVKSIVREMSMDRNNAEERWRETFLQVSNRADDRAAETNTVLRDLSGVIRGIEGRIGR